MANPIGYDNRHDSGYGPGHFQQPPRAGSDGSAVPARAIRGNPEITGVQERLDPNYELKYDDYFQPGTIFAMLFSEPHSATSPPHGDNVTMVQYGEFVYSQIRRFVVVANKRRFCYALPISTYNGRGTLKKSVDPQEHGIIYTADYPQELPGEHYLGVPPIYALIARADIWFDPASRINYGMAIPIQHNVKVRHLGYVYEEHMHILIGHFKQRLYQTC